MEDFGFGFLSLKTCLPWRLGREKNSLIPASQPPRVPAFIDEFPEMLRVRQRLILCQR